QPRLLRVVQEREIQPLGEGKPRKIDVKIIYATNRNLEEMVEKGDFRDDLFERINRFPYKIPPLRERKADIPLLVEHFIEKHDKVFQSNPDLIPIRVSQEAINILKRYEWPRNVRQLENVILRIVKLRNGSDNRNDITRDDLPSKIVHRDGDKQKSVKQGEKSNMQLKVSDAEIVYWMEKLNNNKTHVALKLGVNVKTIRRRCSRLKHLLFIN
ncbi:sigma 54-interacting transcriptional regulator, partial [Thermodesulfobacteriota bacterium]